jgi:hypothetical protein
MPLLMWDGCWLCSQIWNKVNDCMPKKTIKFKQKQPVMAHVCVESTDETACNTNVCVESTDETAWNSNVCVESTGETAL